MKSKLTKVIGILAISAALSLNVYSQDAPDSKKETPKENSQPQASDTSKATIPAEGETAAGKSAVQAPQAPAPKGDDIAKQEGKYSFSTDHKKNIIFITGKYREFITKLIKEQKRDNEMLKIEEPETLLSYLAEKCLDKNQKFNVGTQTFSPYEYAKQANSAVLARLNGKYTSADKALQVASIMKDKLEKDITHLKAKIQNSDLLDPEEEKDLKDKYASEIEDLKFDLAIYEDALKYKEEEISAALSEKKILQIKLKKVAEMLKDTKEAQNADKEIQGNQSKVEENDLKEALESIADSDPNEEKAFLYAEIDEVESALKNLNEEMTDVKARVNETKTQILSFEEKMKAPKREATQTERGELTKQWNAELAKKQEQIDKQKALIPLLESNLEKRKKELAESVKSFPPEMVKSIDDNYGMFETVFSIFVQYKQKADLFGKSDKFKDAFPKNTGNKTDAANTTNKQ